MIKLVTQFDNEKTKLSLATPTCGGCCYCCCCIVSTFATASISTRSFGGFVEEKLPNEPKKIKYVRRWGFWLPIGMLISLGMGLFFAGVYSLNYILMPIVISILYLVAMVYLLKENIRLFYKD